MTLKIELEDIDKPNRAIDQSIEIDRLDIKSSSWLAFTGPWLHE